MKSASFIRGRHWKSGKSIEVVFENGWIREIHTLPNEVASSKWILPPWIDCQVNGYAGIDFQQSGLTQEAMEHATWALKKDGCVGFFPTLITCPWEEMMDRLTHLKALTKKSSLLSNHILGWHLEGPFLSPETGYRGAHDPQCMEDPRPEHLEHIRSITEADPVLLTLAPERKGSMAFIRKAKKLGIRVSLGHTNADTQTLHEAFQAGARALTHLGNACPQQLDRHDNILLRALDPPRWITGLIPDGIHLSPTLFRCLHRWIPASQIYYTTDAMAAAGSPPGRYHIAGLEVEVGADQVVRQPGQSNFAGSALKPIDGILRAAEMLGKNWKDLWPHGSLIPSKWLGLPLGLKVGCKSMCSMVTELPQGKLHVESHSP